MRITLSTNGILLGKKKSILPYIDDIGLPLDGYNAKQNSKMRGGNSICFGCVINAIRFIQKKYSNIDVTVRTVITRINFKTIHLIGDSLVNVGINVKKLRWKLYQCTPLGPRQKEIKKQGLLISNEEFYRVLDRVKQHNTSFGSIVGQSTTDEIGRYFLVYPDGSTKIICNQGNDTPYEVSTGNIVGNFIQVLMNINKNYLFKDRCKTRLIEK
jgi:MoaA/NifB/PqqE/SkfB family radical SAM enzyme